MKIWKDKDWIWFTNDSGMTGTFHVDYLPWLMIVLPKIAHGEIERDELTLPPADEPDPSTSNPT